MDLNWSDLRLVVNRTDLTLRVSCLSDLFWHNWLFRRMLNCFLTCFGSSLYKCFVLNHFLFFLCNLGIRVSPTLEVGIIHRWSQLSGCSWWRIALLASPITAVLTSLRFFTLLVEVLDELHVLLLLDQPLLFLLFKKLFLPFKLNQHHFFILRLTILNSSYLVLEFKTLFFLEFIL